MFVDLDAVYQHAEEMIVQTHDSQKTRRNLGWLTIFDDDVTLK